MVKHNLKGFSSPFHNNITFALRAHILPWRCAIRCHPHRPYLPPSITLPFTSDLFKSNQSCASGVLCNKLNIVYNDKHNSTNISSFIGAALFYFFHFNPVPGRLERIHSELLLIAKYKKQTSINRMNKLYTPTEKRAPNIGKKQIKTATASTAKVFVNII